MRIIGGRWRSRRVRFPAGAGLRPTPDRLRETLFNWLGAWIEGRRVLDLFAGSGALGLEALSRGAAAAVFLERSRTAARALEANVQGLGAVTAEVRCADALAWLRGASEAFDLVFIDPPYAQDLVRPALDILAERRLLGPGHRVYVERPKPAKLPAGWEVLRRACAGSAEGLLSVRDAAAGADSVD